jgi:hypothetical protein
VGTEQKRVGRNRAERAPKPRNRNVKPSSRAATMAIMIPSPSPPTEWAREATAFHQRSLEFSVKRRILDTRP